MNEKISNNYSKYTDLAFIEKYAAIWAYGYKNNIGQTEGLYRTINELGFTSYNKDNSYKILDIGCGVGRTSSDYAKFFKNSKVLGIDESSDMISMASIINKSNGVIDFDLGNLGFGILKLKCELIENLDFLKLDYLDIKQKANANSFDIVTAVNFLDRINNIEFFMNSIYDLLKPQGVFIFSTPMNYSNTEYWSKYSNLESISKLVQQTGFTINVQFDNLIYREVLDARGAFNEYPTVVMKLNK